MEDITKRFGQVEALSGVDMELFENEILAIVGDNGAGKSTLIKILVGVLEPTEGAIYIHGEKATIRNPKDAQTHGIGIVYQDLALVDTMSIASNIFLGNEPMKKKGPFSVVDWETMRNESERILKENLNLELDPTAPVEFLSGGERQGVAISRALVHDPQIVVLDEPTAALSEEVSRRVNELILTLKQQDHSIIIIDHDINRVLEIADRVLVLYQGSCVGTMKTSEITKDEIVQMMITGHETTEARPPAEGETPT